MKQRTIICCDGEALIDENNLKKFLGVEEGDGKMDFSIHPFCTIEVISALNKVAREIFRTESIFSKLGSDTDTIQLEKLLKKKIFCYFLTNNIELIHNTILTVAFLGFHDLLKCWIADTKQKLTYTERNETLYNSICGINDINQDIIYDLFYEIPAIYYSSLKSKYPKFKDILDFMADKPEKICQKYEIEESPFFIIISQQIF